jgi:hypothetical protein
MDNNPIALTDIYGLEAGDACGGSAEISSATELTPGTGGAAGSSEVIISTTTDVQSAGTYIYTYGGEGNFGIENTAISVTSFTNTPQSSNAGVNPQTTNGTDAHTTFSTFIRAKDPTQTLWKANRSIDGKKVPDRPDLVYNNGFIGGVWEIKPAEYKGNPSPSAPKAATEAAGYVLQLNATGGGTTYGTGQSMGAPPPFYGVLPLMSLSSGTIYYFTNPDPNSGAIYWYTYDPSKQPVPSPVPTTESINEKNKEPSNQMQPVRVNPEKVKELVKKTPWYITLAEIVAAIAFFFAPKS